MKVTRVGVDIAKNVFQIHGVDRLGRPIWRRKLKRTAWLRAMTLRLEPGCEVGIEACSGAHHWARELASRGFVAKLISPQFVKPYVKSQKNDATDAEAICEAMSRPGMRFVTPKTVEQQDIQSIHRVRSSVIGQRTAQANQIRGLVAEYGLVAPQHLSSLRKAIPEWLEDAENGLTDRFRALLHGLWTELLRFDDGEQVGPASANPVCLHVHKARLTNWERTREYPSWPGITNVRIEAGYTIAVEPQHHRSAGWQTRRSPYMVTWFTEDERGPITLLRLPRPNSGQELKLDV